VLSFQGSTRILWMDAALDRCWLGRTRCGWWKYWGEIRWSSAEAILLNNNVFFNKTFNSDILTMIALPLYYLCVANSTHGKTMDLKLRIRDQMDCRPRTWRSSAVSDHDQLSIVRFSSWSVLLLERTAQHIRPCLQKEEAVMEMKYFLYRASKFHYKLVLS